MSYKLLVVDDDRDILDAVSSRLIRENYQVVVACDGEEALLRVKGDDPDIVILDLMLPKLNGFDVLKRIRQNYNDRWRPVIIISARNELESLKTCYELQADHYLTKPCTFEKILQGIQTMISLIPIRR
ncbi:MAG: response regulator [Candidatus Omnitrophota bacterium]